MGGWLSLKSELKRTPFKEIRKMCQTNEEKRSRARGPSQGGERLVMKKKKRLSP